MTIAIVGGGLMGLSLGYYLSRQGASVEIFEAASNLGGLADTVTLEDATAVDRFYHVILSSDRHLLGLVDELGLRDQFRCRETKMGFYYHGRVH
jgi:protoporphyrinogen oxidase